MALTRIQHWATRSYHTFLLSRASMPFAWGTHDCALFAADGIEAMTGVDIAAAFRGKYTDEASSLTAIRTITGAAADAVVTVEDAAAWCATQHGLEEWIYPLMAQRGDLAVVVDSGRVIAGLVHLNGRHIVCAGEAGLHRLPIPQIKRAWHV